MQFLAKYEKLYGSGPPWKYYTITAETEATARIDAKEYETKKYMLSCLTEKVTSVS